MSKVNWMFFVSFALMSVMHGLSAGQRDSARAELSQLQALYNGVLIGRGCELPK